MAAVVREGPTDFDRVRALREVLTATGAGIYLGSHLAGPIPAETMAAVHESDDLELRVGRTGPDREDDLDQRMKEARAVAAAAVKASPERLLLTHGVPEATGAIAAALLADRGLEGAATGDRIILRGLTPSVAAVLRLVAAAAGAFVEEVDEVPRILPADVVLVAVAHVDALGTVADVGAARDAAANAGARLLLDASLSVGAVPVEVGDLGVDALVADAHRWLLGPDALGLAWLSPVLGEELPERLASAAGPFGRGSLLALARSLGWLLMYVELPWVLARTEELAQRSIERLLETEGVEVLTDPQRHAAMLAFRIEGWDAQQAVEELGRSVFAILEADLESDVLRVGIGAWNREDELDRFMERVAELAEHTPETLPRRPSLTVISGPTLVPDADETE